MLTQPVSIAVISRLADDDFAEHARWIGAIVANWSVLESEMEGVYSQVLKLDYHHGKIAYYAIQNFPARRDQISAGIDAFYSGTTAEQEWNDLLPRLKTAARIRNGTAHAIWAVNPKTGQLQMRETHVSGKYTRPRADYPVSVLKDRAEHLALVAGSLNKLQTLVRATPQTLHERLR